MISNGERVILGEGALAAMPDAALNLAGVYAKLRDDIAHGTAAAPGFGHAAQLTRVMEGALRSSVEGAVYQRRRVVGMKRVALLTAALLALVSAAPAPARMRLYTLDCGRIDFTNMANYADTGDHDGAHGAMPVTCFLIRHGADWMLSDAGLGDEIADSPGGREVLGMHFHVPRTLASKLAKFGPKPDDIRYIGLSHLHADHSGNAALFPHATFLVSPTELAWASATPRRYARLHRTRQGARGAYPRARRRPACRRRVQPDAALPRLSGLISPAAQAATGVAAMSLSGRAASASSFGSTARPSSALPAT